MKFIIDRFEGEYALCQTKDLKTFKIPKELLKNAFEGDVFDIVFNEKETKEKNELEKNKLNRLFHK